MEKNFKLSKGSKLFLLTKIINKIENIIFFCTQSIIKNFIHLLLKHFFFVHLLQLVFIYICICTSKEYNKNKIFMYKHLINFNCHKYINSTHRYCKTCKFVVVDKIFFYQDLL